MPTPLKAKVAAPRSRDITVNGVKYNRSSSKRNNFEMYAWLFMRLSGVMLVVLIFGHLFVNLMMGEGVHRIDFGFVGGKLANPFWQVWDLLLLWLAMLHGTNGIRTIIDDYAQKDGVRTFLKVILFLASAFVILVGTLVIFTFDPCPVGASAELLPSFCTAP
ncbi:MULTISPECIES: succinate dehydrogenase hydrophobic membrane anchor subunit [unclassified Rothia (in: high G+C Gram-positive bacteria)]|uniref:succinate dehydrogenase hydrophobic membrane anchor subunit n=1 Tax=unclassified Rothia (in: high G+C Gram-positive bacteria) TaxID=2689056 RepID=UPI00195A258F|nr:MULTISPECIES: succinate dehydrogenase hydrophobic membrane anchor subunit [unclassified Rothia (in: high G+C Gram-positive bacteria)]MBM7051468.1 succinate dehydrogenase hydrophobic membrane anchor subunit [Rothia sp. ZJ1223]QRZ61256.1 succinate dehydrogenase hydrophobic membrane anchor subunit [Rothia sp. ZJ932]